MTRNWDVIVVGARVAGSATAMLLARAGLRVLCLDKSRYGSDTVSTHALMRGGVLQLQRWGLLDAIVAADTPPVRRTIFRYGGESVAVSIKPSGGVDALYAPRRTVIDALLVDEAQRAGAVVEFGATVTRLHRDHHGSVAGVVVGRRGGSEWVERAPLVIGADGRQSLVAREVGARATVLGQQASAFIYGYFAHLATDGYEWSYRPGLATGAIPTNGGLTCVFVAGHPSRLSSQVLAGTASSVFNQWCSKVGLLQRVEAAERVGSFRYVRGLPAGYLRTAHGPGWALVGDAGHWMDPMSTHGMTSALRDAALLARAVVESTLPAGRLAPADYEDVRDRLSVPMMKVTDEIAAYHWDLTRIRGLLRGLSSAMTDEVEMLATLEPVA
jgi:flavin-dependent dehydrogenase